MKHTPWGRFSVIGLLVSAMSLSGCSSLEIDVDVYKGPLSQTPDVQFQQYISLAQSARPLLKRLKDTADAIYIKNCPSGSTGANANGPQTCENQDARYARDFLRNVLCLYQDAHAPKEASDGSASNTDTCIDSAPQSPAPAASSGSAVGNLQAQLSKELGTGANASKYFILRPQLRNETLGLDSLTRDVVKLSGMPKTKENSVQLATAVAALNESLIYFAQYILFTVNNQTLFKELDADEAKTFKAQTALLQSLGNTILVHANDIQRRLDRQAGLDERAMAERSAIQNAFRTVPALVLDQMADALDATPATQESKPTASTIATLNDKQQKATSDLAEARTRLDEYRRTVASLEASYRTLVADPKASLSDVKTPKGELDVEAEDRKTIAGLFKDEVANPAPESPLTPLQEWLDLELATTIRVVPARFARLAATKAFLEAEKARLTKGIATDATGSASLKTIKARISASFVQASTQLGDYQNAVKAKQGELDKISKANSRLDAHVQLATRSQQATAEAERIRAVLLLVRAGVLAQADAEKIADPAGIKNLLSRQLALLKPAPDTGRPSNEDIALARTAIGKLAAPPASPCPDKDAESCNGKDPIVIIDSLIATLRAQRIQALAIGDKPSANNLLEAINAAYDQRTAMVYLRPASDYLKSVYSANAFQDGTATIHRNMLTEWLKYQNPFEDKREEDQPRAELEKLYWQNINKVTVAGGGRTNYVLAKDDVGNWYVKAYSADPEAIIKSATSLALFNSGKTINANLLRRYEIQRQIDDPATGTDARKRLSGELAQNNSQDGAPLLKIRDRYATRYAKDTKDQATKLLAALTVLPARVEEQVDATDGMGEACKLADAKQGLPLLDTGYLSPARTQLQTLSTSALTAKNEAPIADIESAIQTGLTAIHLYSAQVYKTLAESKAEGCDELWRRHAAERARAVPHGQLLTIAQERKLSIDRYEEALSSVAEVAAENAGSNPAPP